MTLKLAVSRSRPSDPYRANLLLLLLLLMLLMMSSCDVYFVNVAGMRRLWITRLVLRMMTAIHMVSIVTVAR